MNRRNPFGRSLLLAAIFSCIGTTLYAQTQPITLAWDAIPDAAVAGYVVLVGTVSGSYVEQHDVGKKTAFVYANVSPGQPYFFAVAAYTPGRVIGQPSEEIFFLAGNSAGSEPVRMSGTTASSLRSDGSRWASCASADETGCYRVERVADLIGEVSALAPAGDGRLFFVDGEGRRIRVIANDTLMPDAALTADGATRLAGLVLDPGFDRNRFMYVGEVDTRADGSRELTIIRYREVANALAEGAAIVTGLPLPPNGDAPFTIDGAGRLYVAMPGAVDGMSTGSPYAGMLLRFESDGRVARDSRGVSPVLAHGYARPTSLVWNSAQNELWLAGFNAAEWDGSLARLPLTGNAAEWPRLPHAAVLESDASIVSLFSGRSMRGLSATDGASGSLILIEAEGGLLRIDTQTQRVAASITLSTAAIGGDPTLATLDGSNIYVVVSAATTDLVPTSQIVRLRQH